MVFSDTSHTEIASAEKLKGGVPHFLLETGKIMPALKMITGEGVAQDILLPLCDTCRPPEVSPKFAPIRWTDHPFFSQVERDAPQP